MNKCVPAGGVLYATKTAAVRDELLTLCSAQYNFAVIIVSLSRHLDDEDGGKVDREENRDGGDEVSDCEEVEPDGQDASKDLEQEREVDEECV